MFTTYLFNIFNIEVRVWGPSKPIGFLVGPIFTKIIQDTHENQVICTLSNNGIIMMSQRFARLKQDDSRLANLDFETETRAHVRPGKITESRFLLLHEYSHDDCFTVLDTHENQVICTLSNNGIIMMSQRFARLKQDDSRLVNLDFDILVPD